MANLKVSVTGEDWSLWILALKSLLFSIKKLHISQMTCNTIEVMSGYSAVKIKFLCVFLEVQPWMQNHALTKLMPQWKNNPCAIPSVPNISTKFWQNRLWNVYVRFFKLHDAPTNILHNEYIDGQGVPPATLKCKRNIHKSKYKSFTDPFLNRTFE